MANPNAHIHVPFLTQMTVLVGNLGFQSMTDHYETPCKSRIGKVFEFPKAFGIFGYQKVVSLLKKQAFLRMLLSQHPKRDGNLEF